jgi:hypothetical protein
MLLTEVTLRSTFDASNGQAVVFGKEKHQEFGVTKTGEGKYCNKLHQRKRLRRMISQNFLQRLMHRAGEFLDESVRNAS